MATKTNKSLLSATDFDQFRVIVREEVAVEVSQQLEEKLAFLPNKDEFYSKMDEFIGEVNSKLKNPLIRHSKYYSK